MGGMNSIMENPFEIEDAEQLADQVFADSYVFNMKVQKFITHCHMTVARAKHFSCIYVDPRDPTNRIAVAAGGIIIKRHIDLFLKQKKQEYLDSAIVEQFDFATSEWITFNARLSIARHSAAICELKGQLYVIGGHRVELPLEFICSIEQAPVRCQQSTFNLIQINYGGMDLRIQTLLAMPLVEDNGIMIVSDHSEIPYMNQGFFIDLGSNSMKTSKFFHQVGPVHHWQNSCAKYKKFTAYLTDELQLLRFDHQTCDWSTHDLAYIDWATQPNEPEFDEPEIGDDNYGDDDSPGAAAVNKKKKKQKKVKEPKEKKEKKEKRSKDKKMK